MKKTAYILITLFLISCSSYQKLLQRGTSDDKFIAAKNFFLEKKYSKSAALFEDIMSKNAFSGRKMEEVIFLLAESYRNNNDYYSASMYYGEYIKNYPGGTYIKQAMYQIAYCFYLDSPDPRLDQLATHRAINAFTEYIQVYPDGDDVQKAYAYIDELKNKLAYKGLLEAKLYYNLGLYYGNNYRSAILTAENTLKEFPNSKYREALSFLILKSKYTEAKKSVVSKLAERFSEVVDEYYRYSSEFENSKNIKEAEKMYNEAKKIISKNNI